METFSALLAICAGNSPVTGEFPSPRSVTQSFDVYLIGALNKRLSKQWWGWWFETPSSSLWRHCNPQQQTEISYRWLCRWCRIQRRWYMTIYHTHTVFKLKFALIAWPSLAESFDGFTHVQDCITGTDTIILVASVPCDHTWPIHLV